jgi:hypothetical protein
VDRDILDHPKTLRLASRCGWSPERAVGRLLRMWSWVARYAPSGELGPLEGAALGVVMGRAEAEAAIEANAQFIPGAFPVESRSNPGFEPVLLPMDSASYPQGLSQFVEAGFLHEADGGGYVVHDWYEMNGTQLRERAYDRRRQSCDTSIPTESRAIPGFFPSATETETVTVTVRDGNTTQKTPPEAGAVRFVEFPLVDGTAYHVTVEQLEVWRELFPGIDVAQSLRNCLAWNMANPANRKTRRGIQGHITRWLASDQDRARPDRKQTGHRAGADERYRLANAGGGEE